MPEFYTTEKEGMHIKAKLGFDIKCKKKKEDKDFS